MKEILIHLLKIITFPIAWVIVLIFTAIWSDVPSFLSIDDYFATKEERKSEEANYKKDWVDKIGELYFVFAIIVSVIVVGIIIFLSI